MSTQTYDISHINILLFFRCMNAAVIKPWGLIEVLNSERTVIPLPLLSQTTDSFESVSWPAPIPSHLHLLLQVGTGCCQLLLRNLTCAPFLHCCPQVSPLITHHWKTTRAPHPACLQGPVQDCLALCHQVNLPSGPYNSLV